MNTSLFQELEAAIRAVEPRVLEGYNPGLSDAEIDALMANVSFDLPEDLRALYRWRNGHRGTGYGGFLGSLWWMAPLTASNEDSLWLREDLTADWTSDQKLLPPDVGELNFLQLFGDGSGYSIIASCSPREATCQIYQMDKGSVNIDLMFRGVETMIQTALEWWQSNVFYSPYERQFGWDLEQDFNKESEIARRLNSDCGYWWS